MATIQSLAIKKQKAQEALIEYLHTQYPDAPKLVLTNRTRHGEAHLNTQQWADVEDWLTQNAGYSVPEATPLTSETVNQLVIDALVEIVTDNEEAESPASSEVDTTIVESGWQAGMTAADAEAKLNVLSRKAMESIIEAAGMSSQLTGRATNERARKFIIENGIPIKDYFDPAWGENDNAAVITYADSVS